MKLGLLTAPFPETPLSEVADWAADNGFESLEICCWPSDAGTQRRYGGICHIDVDGLTQDEADQIVSDLDGKGLTISGLGYYPNPLNPKRYIVLNSSFTYREYDYLNNARQIPKLPDWAIIDLSERPGTQRPGKIVDAGFFGERWELK